MISCGSCAEATLLTKLTAWVEVMAKKFADTLLLSKEKQLHGSALLALEGLAKVTVTLLAKNGNSERSDRLIGPLQNELGKLLAIVQGDGGNATMATSTMSMTMGRYLGVSIIRRGTVGEGGLSLLGALIRYDLIALPHRASLVHRCLALSAVKDMRTVESPLTLRLLAIAIAKAEEVHAAEASLTLAQRVFELGCLGPEHSFEHPSFTTLSAGATHGGEVEDTSVSIMRRLLMLLSSSSSSSSSALRATRPSSSSSSSSSSTTSHHTTTTTTAAIASISTSVPIRGLVYIVTWLDHQVSSESRLSSINIAEFADALSDLLHACMVGNERVFSPLEQRASTSEAVLLSSITGESKPFWQSPLEGGVAKGGVGDGCIRDVFITTNGMPSSSSSSSSSFSTSSCSTTSNTPTSTNGPLSITLLQFAYDSLGLLRTRLTNRMYEVIATKDDSLEHFNGPQVKSHALA